jgi:cobalt-zinc-cadmium efflux system membrane fusion protein
MKLNEKFKSRLRILGDFAKGPTQKILEWSRVSFERTAIVGVLLAGGLCAILILTIDKGGGDHHEGDEHGEEGGEEGGHGEGDEHGEEVELSDEALESSGIKIETTKKNLIQHKLRLGGRIVPNRDHFTVIKPRFAGVVKKVVRDLGDQVTAGAVLAVIESNSARASFEVKTGISGTIIYRQAVTGAFAPETEALFKIADLSSVWVEVDVPDRDFNIVNTGQAIHVTDPIAKVEADVKVTYVSPIVYEDTQSLLLRAELANPEGRWKAGSFIETEITVTEIEAPVSVKSDAIQQVENQAVVFVRDGEHFVAKPVQVGVVGKEFAEIRSGLAEGEEYAALNSYIVKAELLKKSAAHEH